MKKSDTIALYRDAYLEGKDEIDRRKFEEKPDDKKYAAIMAWKRRQTLSAEMRDKPSVNTLVETLKKICKDIENLPELSPKDASKLQALTESITYNITNFDMIKKGQRLRMLKSQRSSLDKEIEILESEGVKEC